VSLPPTAAPPYTPRDALDPAPILRPRTALPRTRSFRILDQLLQLKGVADGCVTAWSNIESMQLPCLPSRCVLGSPQLFLETFPVRSPPLENVFQLAVRIGD
jgi:hypothetical protein